MTLHGRAFLIVGALVTLFWATAGNGSSSIELYSASYCGECARAKAYMKKNKIRFTDYDIENDIPRRREFYDRGGVAIPLFYIGGRKMEGFDEQRFEALRREIQ